MRPGDLLVTWHCDDQYSIEVVLMPPPSLQMGMIDYTDLQRELELLGYINPLQEDTIQTAFTGSNLYYDTGHCPSNDSSTVITNYTVPPDYLKPKYIDLFPGDIILYSASYWIVTESLSSGNVEIKCVGANRTNGIVKEISKTLSSDNPINILVSPMRDMPVNWHYTDPNRAIQISLEEKDRELTESILTFKREKEEQISLLKSDVLHQTGLLKDTVNFIQPTIPVDQPINVIIEDDNDEYPELGTLNSTDCIIKFEEDE